MTDREKLLTRIRALMSKTTANGCTEAEAIAAAEKVAALMQEHAVSEAVLEMANASIAVRTDTKSVKSLLWSAIGLATDCGVMFTRDGKEKTVLYVGFAPGPEIACYLHDIVHRAVEAAVKEFRGGKFYKARRAAKTRRKAVDDFTDGMVRSLASRLVRIFRDTSSPERRQKALKALDEMFPRSQTVKMKEGKIRFGEAQNDGYDAGRRVAINRGVGRDDQKLIGS